VDLTKKIGACGLIPVVVIDDASNAVKTAMALKKGNVDLMEITLRTPAGLDAIEKVANDVDEVIVGAGTVLSLENAKSAIDRGAKFIVTPGSDPEIVSYCLEKNILIIPGCITPTEIMAAMKQGIDTIKFFPANLYGGYKAIQSLASVFGNIKFIPTGGIGVENILDYQLPAVLAVGGAWLCPREDIAQGNFKTITEICLKTTEKISEKRSM